MSSLYRIIFHGGRLWALICAPVPPTGDERRAQARADWPWNFDRDLEAAWLSDLIAEHWRGGGGPVAVGLTPDAWGRLREYAPPDAPISVKAGPL